MANPPEIGPCLDQIVRCGSVAGARGARALRQDRPPFPLTLSGAKPTLGDGGGRHSRRGLRGQVGEELRQARSSPVVRKIAAEHHVDISGVTGTGIGGRVTKQDILDHIDRQAHPPAGGPEPVTAPAPAVGAPTSSPSAASARA